MIPIERAVKKGERPDLSKQHFPRYVFNSRKISYTHAGVYPGFTAGAGTTGAIHRSAVRHREDHAENSGAHTGAQQLLQSYSTARSTSGA